MFLIVSGEMGEGIGFLLRTPDVVSNILSEAVIGYMGVFFYLGVVQRFGVAVCIAVSAMRKIATILISFLIFPKPFSIMYVYGATMVLVSIFMTAYAKNLKKEKARVKTHVV